MENKENILVIFGGKSVEHDISIITGVQILNALDKERYNVIPVYLSKENVFYTSPTLFDISFYTDSNFSKKLKELVLLTNGKIYEKKRSRLKEICKVNFVYLALHGGSGEGGGMQGYLDLCSVSYASPGVLGSSICLDKEMTKLLLKANNIDYVKYVTITTQDKEKGVEKLKKKLSKLSFPVIVKPNSLGSSIGVTYCNTVDKAINGIDFASLFDCKVIVEEAVQNLREFNIALIGNSFNFEESSIEEVKSSGDFLTFENKYMDGKKENNSSDRIIPADIDEELEKRIKSIALKVYNVFSLKGCVRIDFLVNDKDKKVYVNEINTIPGSLANYLWKNQNYNFTQFLEKIKDYALTQDRIKNKKVVNFSSSVLNKFNDNEKLNFKK